MRIIPPCPFSHLQASIGDSLRNLIFCDRDYAHGDDHDNVISDGYEYDDDDNNICNVTKCY